MIIIILSFFNIYFNIRLSKLKILELRENRLKTLPKSLDNLKILERLDIGTNEFDVYVNDLFYIFIIFELSYR